MVTLSRRYASSPMDITFADAAVDIFAAAFRRHAATLFRYFFHASATLRPPLRSMLPLLTPLIADAIER